MGFVTKGSNDINAATKAMQQESYEKALAVEKQGYVLRKLDNRVAEIDVELKTATQSKANTKK